MAASWPKGVTELFDFEELAQALRPLRVAQLGERLRLDLADALTRDAERLADFLERLRLAAIEAEPHPHDLLLALAQLAQHLLADLLSNYRAHPEDARALIAFGESKADPTLDAPTLAAWTMLSNELMNLDEALNK